MRRTWSALMIFCALACAFVSAVAGLIAPPFSNAASTWAGVTIVPPNFLFSASASWVATCCACAIV